MPKNLSEQELNNLASDYMRYSGESVTPAEIAAIAANFDEEAEIEAAKKEYEVELWDKKSPINGVDAHVILEARDDIPEGGEVYLVIDKKDGTVTFFQPYIPGQEGLNKITKNNWEDTALKHKDEIAVEKANQKFMNDIPASLQKIRNKKA